MIVLRRTQVSFSVLASCLFLTSCAVGPDFLSPAAPAITSYEATALPNATSAAPIPLGGSAQSFAPGSPIAADWWTLYQSEPLNGLIKLALEHNPDLGAAEASLRQAHETTLAGYGLVLPQLDAGLTAQREKLSGIEFGSNQSIPPFTLVSPSLSISYSLDVFGGARREIESLAATEDYQRFEMEAARLTLTGNVVTTAVQEASLRAQIDATNSIIAEDNKELGVLHSQFQLGGIAKSGYLAQVATVAQAEATLPPLEKQLSQTRHSLSVMAGEFPSSEPNAKFELKGLTLPLQIPVSLPSALVAQRPDIKAAEASLHAASAQIGVATANMLPQFNLTGNVGSDAATLAGLFTPGTGIWSLAAGVTQPIFHGGELLHRKRAAVAAYDEAAQIYRKAVLSAFQDVADSLHALQSDAEALKAEADSEHAANDSLQLTEQQYKDGAITYVTLLTAEQTEDQAKLLLVQAQARRFADTAALFVALGGGWWNAPLPDPKSSGSPPIPPEVQVPVAAGVFDSNVAGNGNPTITNTPNFNQDRPSGGQTPAGKGE